MKFVKFNNNSGRVNMEARSEDDELVDLMMSFSHFTHAHSDREHMVVDLQGWVDKRRRTVWLTDPAIHSKNLLKFGKTNLGPPGMSRFFATHKCSEICKYLKLPREDKNRSMHSIS